MAKTPVLSPVTTGYDANRVINQNFDRIKEQFLNTVSRDGSTPNEMNADLDMNSNDILNAMSVSTQKLLLGDKDVFEAIPTLAEISELTQEVREALDILETVAYQKQVILPLVPDVDWYQIDVDYKLSQGIIVELNGLTLVKGVDYNIEEVGSVIGIRFTETPGLTAVTERCVIRISRAVVSDAPRTAFPSRESFVAAQTVGSWAVGDVVAAGGLSYRYVGAGTAIADLPGWVPVGGVYPEHFGARAVAGFDSSPALQAAIDYCKGDNASQHRGRHVLNLNEEDGYRIQKGLFIDRPISIRGNGAMQTRFIYSETFAQRDGAPGGEVIAGLVVAVGYDTFDYATEAGINAVVQLENLDMRYNGNFTTPVDGIRRAGILVKTAASNAVRGNLRMNQVSVRTFSHHALWGLNGGVAVQADNCRFHDNYGAGVRIDSRTDWFFTRCMFAGSRDPATSGIDMNGAAEIQFSQCDVYSNKGYGIRQYASSFRFIDGMVDRNAIGGYRHRSITAKEEVVFVGTKFGLNSFQAAPAYPDIQVPTDATPNTLKLIGVGFYPVTTSDDSSLVNIRFDGAGTGVITMGCTFGGNLIPTVANKGTTHEGRVIFGLTNAGPPGPFANDAAAAAGGVAVGQLYKSATGGISWRQA